MRWYELVICYGLCVIWLIIYIVSQLYLVIVVMDMMNDIELYTLVLIIYHHLSSLVRGADFWDIVSDRSRATHEDWWLRTDTMGLVREDWYDATGAWGLVIDEDWYNATGRGLVSDEDWYDATETRTDTTQLGEDWYDATERWTGRLRTGADTMGLIRWDWYDGTDTMELVREDWYDGTGTNEDCWKWRDELERARITDWRQLTSEDCWKWREEWDKKREESGVGEDFFKVVSSGKTYFKVV